jgi:DNA-binding NarL/FixJ family response regulator
MLRHARNASALILADHSEASFLKDLLVSWGFRSSMVMSLPRPPDAADLSHHNLVLIDLDSPSGDGAGVISQILETCSGARIIVFSTDFGITAKAMDHGVFDFLGKPFQPIFLYYRLLRALDSLEKEKKIGSLKDELTQKQYELAQLQILLDAFEAKLDENNNALSVLAENLNLAREQAEKKLALKLRSMVIPAVEKLKRIKALEPYSTELNVIISLVEDLSSDFILDARITTLLSSSELKIASLIKNGMSTEEIARICNISSGTVRTHRKNIRRKLNIGKAFSLHNFLVSQTGGQGGNGPSNGGTKIRVP